MPSVLGSEPLSLSSVLTYPPGSVTSATRKSTLSQEQVGHPLTHPPPTLTSLPSTCVAPSPRSHRLPPPHLTTIRCRRKMTSNWPLPCPSMRLRTRRRLRPREHPPPLSPSRPHPLPRPHPRQALCMPPLSTILHQW